MGRYAASCSDDTTVKIWEVQTNTCVATLQGHTSYVYGVSFSPDGKYVASCSSDMTVQIWKVQTNKCVATLKGHTGGVLGVSFSADGPILCNGKYDQDLGGIDKQMCRYCSKVILLQINGMSSFNGRYVESQMITIIKIWI